MQREALIGLTVILTLIALGASPDTDPLAQNLSEPADNTIITTPTLSSNGENTSDGATRLEITGTNDDERIVLTMQLDVAI